MPRVYTRILFRGSLNAHHMITSRYSYGIGCWKAMMQTVWCCRRKNFEFNPEPTASQTAPAVRFYLFSLSHYLTTLNVVIGPVVTELALSSFYLFIKQFHKNTTADNTPTGPTRWQGWQALTVAPVKKKQQLLGLYTYMLTCSYIRYTGLK